MNAPISTPFLDIPTIPLRDYQHEVIMECVCKAYQLTRDMLTGERKNGRLAEARQVAVWLIRTRTGWNQAQIGELLNRDASTIKAALMRINQQRLKDTKLDRFMDELAKAVDARLA